MKKITIHQPEHMPYPGFIAKVLQSDIFVVLDHVQYRKNYFQNRNKIFDENNKEFWMTIPLEKSSSETPINKKIVLRDNKWKLKYLNKIKTSYCQCLNFNEIYPILKKIILTNNQYLSEINLKIINFILIDLFKYKGEIILSSNLKLSSLKSDLNLEICKLLSADVYLSGPSGREYLKKDSFDENNIIINFVDYKLISFTSNISPFLSIIDPLMRYEFNNIKNQIIKNTYLSDV